MGSKRIAQSGKSEEERRKEAEEIGYQVVGPLDPSSEYPFKRYEPFFAVVEVWVLSSKARFTITSI